MKFVKVLVGFFLLFWELMLEIFLVVLVISGKISPILSLLVGVWLGYQYNPWFTRLWLKINRKFDEWANV